MYDVLFDRLLTRVDAERAHHLGFRALRTARPVLERAGRLRRGQAPVGAPVRAMGLSFPHPLGLAAGFDKNAEGIDALAALGFGHVEIGTVTAQAQPGNPQPRLFRLPRDRAVVNRMGFNNHGAAVVAGRLAGRRTRLARRQDATGTPPRQPVLGINIGKTKVVPEERAVEDYRASTRLLAGFADYLVVNVSSPNTPGLRDLQAVEKLGPLLEAVRRTADTVTERRVPLLVKIAPDLSDDDVLAVGALAHEVGLDGIIATNTTISRDGLVSDRDDVAEIGAGGLSGAPLRHRATEVMRLLRDAVGPDLALVGVGGIDSPEAARERMAAGATLVQAYTGFVYGGPAWPGQVARGLTGG